MIDFWSRTYVWVRVTKVYWFVQVGLRLHAKNQLPKLKKTLLRWIYTTAKVTYEYLSIEPTVYWLNTVAWFWYIKTSKCTNLHSVNTCQQPKYVNIGIGYWPRDGNARKILNSRASPEVWFTIYHLCIRAKLWVPQFFVYEIFISQYFFLYINAASLWGWDIVRGVPNIDGFIWLDYLLHEIEFHQ